MSTAARPSSLVPLVVACAYFMENLDGTIIATALPSMAASFDVAPAAMSIGITAYLVSVAACIPLSGWLADRYGSRTILCGAIAAFTLASLWCGLAHGLWEFTAARVCQGIGGAMMVPVGRLVVLRSVPRSQFVRAMSWVTIPGVIGQVMGPPAGGFFASYLSWRWMFFLNIPIGVVGAVLVALLIDNIRASECPRFDWSGALLVGATLGCGVLALNSIAARGALMPIALLLAAATVFCALALRHLRRHAGPILDLSLLRLPTFALALVGGSLFRMANAQIGFLLPLLLQVGFGISAFLSGALVFFSAFGAFLMKASAPAVLRRAGFRQTLRVNGLLSALSIFCCVLFTHATPMAMIAITLLIGGFVRSLQFAALNTVVYADVPDPQASAATTFSSMLQPLASGVGVAVSAVVLRVVDNPRGGSGDLPLTDVDIRIALGLAALACLSAALPFRYLAADAGVALTGHRLAPHARRKS